MNAALVWTKRTAAWLLLPFWVAQVFTGCKTFAPNPILGNLLLNRRGLHVWRTRLAHRLASRRRAKLSRLLTADERAAFDRDGFLVKRDFLPASAFATLLEEVGACRRDAFEYVEGRATTRRVPVDLKTARALPQCRGLIESPGWRGLLRYVAACNTPPSVFVEVIETRGEVRAIDPQTKLHMDTFHPTMKAWLFLTDVREDQGPFTYVPGSHRPTRRRLAWQRGRSVAASRGGPTGGAFRIDASELKRLRLPQPVRFTVPGNTLIVADTYGFHARGESIGSAVRFEIHAASRENPFTPFLGLELQRIGYQYLRLSAYAFFIRLGRGLGLSTGVNIAPAAFEIGEESSR
jgi:Phytanoyl-CoA dioxygenase (PhyH)